MSEPETLEPMTRDEVIAAAREVVRKEAVIVERTPIIERELAAEWEANGYNWRNSTGFHYALMRAVREGCGFNARDLFEEARQIEAACVYIVAQLPDSNGDCMVITAAPGMVTSAPQLAPHLGQPGEEVGT